MSLLFSNPWTRQPQQPTEVDWNNPLARGLSSAMVASPFPSVITNSTAVLLTGTKTPETKVDTFGVGLKCSVTKYIEGTGQKLSGPAFTRIVSLKIGSSGTFSNSTQDGVTTNGAQFRMSGDALQFVRSGFVVALSVASQVTLNEVCTVGLSYDGTNAVIYKNGIQVGSATSAQSINYDGMQIGHRGAGTEVFNGTIYQHLDYNRILSSKEVAEISANPWQIFKPFQRKIWVPVAASGGISITLLANALTLTDDTLQIQQAVNIGLISDSFTLTDQILLIEQDQNITLSADSLVLTDQVLQIQQAVNVDIVADSFTLTDGALSITQGSNVVISLTPDSFTLSDQTLLIQQDQNISLSADSLVLTDQTLQIQQDKNISLEADTFTLNDGLILIQQAKNIDLLADSFTLNGGTLGIAVGSNVVVSLTPDSFTLSDQVLQIQQDQNIILVSDSLTLSGQTLQIQQAVNIDLLSDGLILSDGLLSITTATGTVVSLTADTFILTEAVLSVNVVVNTLVTLTPDSFLLNGGLLTITTGISSCTADMSVLRTVGIPEIINTVTSGSPEIINTVTSSPSILLTPCQ